MAVEYHLATLLVIYDARDVCMCMLHVVYGKIIWRIGDKWRVHDSIFTRLL